MTSIFRTLAIVGLASMLAVAVPAVRAQGTAGDDSLYLAWGGKAGIRAVMEDFVPRLEADPRIGKFFKRQGRENLVLQLSDQLCKIAGGPCVYGGAPMDKVHRDLEAGPITKADFNALVEVLQVSMGLKGIPFSAQNAMLARLAPMYRDMVSQD